MHHVAQLESRAQVAQIRQGAQVNQVGAEDNGEVEICVVGDEVVE